MEKIIVGGVKTAVNILGRREFMKLALTGLSTKACSGGKIFKDMSEGPTKSSEVLTPEVTAIPPTVSDKPTETPRAWTITPVQAKETETPNPIVYIEGKEISTEGEPHYLSSEAADYLKARGLVPIGEEVKGKLKTGRTSTVPVTNEETGEQKKEYFTTVMLTKNLVYEGNPELVMGEADPEKGVVPYNGKGKDKWNAIFRVRTPVEACGCVVAVAQIGNKLGMNPGDTVLFVDNWFGDKADSKEEVMVGYPWKQIIYNGENKLTKIDDKQGSVWIVTNKKNEVVDVRGLMAKETDVNDDKVILGGFMEKKGYLDLNKGETYEMGLEKLDEDIRERFKGKLDIYVIHYRDKFGEKPPIRAYSVPGVIVGWRRAIDGEGRKLIQGCLRSPGRDGLIRFTVGVENTATGEIDLISPISYLKGDQQSVSTIKSTVNQLELDEMLNASVEAEMAVYNTGVDEPVDFVNDPGAIWSVLEDEPSTFKADMVRKIFENDQGVRILSDKKVQGIILKGLANDSFEPIRDLRNGLGYDSFLSTNLVLRVS